MKKPSLPAMPQGIQAPSSDAFQQQLQAQYMQQQNALNQQVTQYQQTQQTNALISAQTVANQQASLSSSVNAATQAPVTMATLLTSPKGILGNPTLSYTKLGG